MPSSYGVPTDGSGGELLPWSWAVEQLTAVLGEHGAPLAALARARDEQRRSQNGLGAADIAPGVAIRPADVPDGGGQRAEPRDRLEQAQPAVAHHEPAV